MRLKLRDNSGSWYCPLLKKCISEGMCLEINYERLKLFKTDHLKKLKKTMTLNKINHTCKSCPNLPI